MWEGEDRLRTPIVKASPSGAPSLPPTLTAVTRGDCVTPGSEGRSVTACPDLTAAYSSPCCSSRGGDVDALHTVVEVDDGESSLLVDEAAASVPSRRSAESRDILVPVAGTTRMPGQLTLGLARQQGTTRAAHTERRGAPENFTDLVAALDAQAWRVPSYSIDSSDSPVSTSTSGASSPRSPQDVGDSGAATDWPRAPVQAALPSGSCFTLQGTTTSAATVTTVTTTTLTTTVSSGKRSNSGIGANLYTGNQLCSEASAPRSHADSLLKSQSLRAQDDAAPLMSGADIAPRDCCQEGASGVPKTTALSPNANAAPPPSPQDLSEPCARAPMQLCAVSPLREEGSTAKAREVGAAEEIPSLLFISPVLSPNAAPHHQRHPLANEEAGAARPVDAGVAEQRRTSSTFRPVTSRMPQTNASGGAVPSVPAIRLPVTRPVPQGEPEGSLASFPVLGYGPRNAPFACSLASTYSCRSARSARHHSSRLNSTLRRSVPSLRQIFPTLPDHLYLQRDRLYISQDAKQRLGSGAYGTVQQAELYPPGVEMAQMFTPSMESAHYYVSPGSTPRLSPATGLYSLQSFPSIAAATGSSGSVSAHNQSRADSGFSGFTAADGGGCGDEGGSSRRWGVVPLESDESELSAALPLHQQPYNQRTASFYNGLEDATRWCTAGDPTEAMRIGRLRSIAVESMTPAVSTVPTIHQEDGEGLFVGERTSRAPSEGMNSTSPTACLRSPTHRRANSVTWADAARRHLPDVHLPTVLCVPHQSDSVTTTESSKTSVPSHLHFLHRCNADGQSPVGEWDGSAVRMSLSGEDTPQLQPAPRPAMDASVDEDDVAGEAEGTALERSVASTTDTRTFASPFSPTVRNLTQHRRFQADQGADSEMDEESEASGLLQQTASLTLPVTQLYSISSASGVAGWSRRSHGEATVPPASVRAEVLRVCSRDADSEATPVSLCADPNDSAGEETNSSRGTALPTSRSPPRRRPRCRDEVEAMWARDGFSHTPPGGQHRGTPPLPPHVSDHVVVVEVEGGAVPAEEEEETNPLSCAASIPQEGVLPLPGRQGDDGGGGGSEGESREMAELRFLVCTDDPAELHRHESIPTLVGEVTTYLKADEVAAFPAAAPAGAEEKSCGQLCESGTLADESCKKVSATLPNVVEGWGSALLGATEGMKAAPRAELKEEMAMVMADRTLPASVAPPTSEGTDSPAPKRIQVPPLSSGRAVHNSNDKGGREMSGSGSGSGGRGGGRGDVTTPIPASGSCGISTEPGMAPAALPAVRATSTVEVCRGTATMATNPLHASRSFPATPLLRLGASTSMVSESFVNSCLPFRPVATKIIEKEDLASNARKLNAFHNELRMASRLHHPCLVNVFGVAEDADYFYLVMDLAEKGNVAEYLQRFGVEDTREMAPRFLADVVLALEYLRDGARHPYQMVAPEGAERREQVDGHQSSLGKTTGRDVPSATSPDPLDAVSKIAQNLTTETVPAIAKRLYLTPSATSSLPSPSLPQSEINGVSGAGAGGGATDPSGDSLNVSPLSPSIFTAPTAPVDAPPSGAATGHPQQLLVPHTEPLVPSSDPRQHQESIILHRDLKPENLLLTWDFHVKLADFGDSCFYGDVEANNFGGTLSFISPEMIRFSKASPYSDLWALGCILYELLVGQRLFTGTAVEIGHAVQQFHPDTLSFPERPGLPTEEAAAAPFPASPRKDPGDRRSSAPAVGICEAAKDLVRQLLQPLPEARLGSVERGSFEALKAHPFFADIDWGKVLQTSNMTLTNTDYAAELGTYLDPTESVVYCSPVQFLSAVTISGGGEEGGIDGPSHAWPVGGMQMLVLTDGPNLFLVDPEAGMERCEIPWSPDLQVQVLRADRFSIIVPYSHGAPPSSTSSRTLPRSSAALSEGTSPLRNHDAAPVAAAAATQRILYAFADRNRRADLWGVKVTRLQSKGKPARAVESRTRGANDGAALSSIITQRTGAEGVPPVRRCTAASSLHLPCYSRSTGPSAVDENILKQMCRPRAARGGRPRALAVSLSTHAASGLRSRGVGLARSYADFYSDGDARAMATHLTRVGRARASSFELKSSVPPQLVPARGRNTLVTDSNLSVPLRLSHEVSHLGLRHSVSGALTMTVASSSTADPPDPTALSFPVNMGQCSPGFSLRSPTDAGVAQAGVGARRSVTHSFSSAADTSVSTAGASPTVTAILPILAEEEMPQSGGTFGAPP